MKFLRGFYYVMDSTGYESVMLMKLLYEFWGYCINGTASLTSPGGIQAVSGPTNFFENTPGPSLPIMLNGSDGATSSGTNTFSSATGGFTTDMVGKLLVIWKPSSGSSEDSIYPILSVAGDGKSCVLDVNRGGTPDGITLKPSFTTRSSINFRVLNHIAASKITLTAGHNFQMLMDPTGINTGQATAWVYVTWKSASNIAVQGYPGGYGTSPNTGEVGTISGQSTLWYNMNASARGCVTIIGDKSMLLTTFRSDNLSAQNNSVLHIEIPKRIFTQTQDPNPLIIGHGGQLGMTSFYENSTNSFYCVGYDNTAYRQYMTVRSLVGYGRTWETASYYIQGSEMTDARIGFNLHRGKALLGDIANSQQVNGQYEMVRSVLRGVKVGAAAFKQYHLLGDTGEWIHLFNGYCWPWDGTYLPFPLLAYGGGS